MSESSRLERALNWVKKKGYSNIKSTHEDYQSTKSFILQQGEQTVNPHISAERMGTKNYFEIATKTDEVSSLVSKWKLLSVLAARTGGRLFLLAPRGHKSFTESICDRHLTSAEVVYLKN